MRTAYRVGAALVLGGLAVGLSRPRVPLRSALLTLGRASLFVYWVHLEFAFGILAKPIAHRLPLLTWPLDLALLIVSMTALARSGCVCEAGFSACTRAFLTQATQPRTPRL